VPWIRFYRFFKQLDFAPSNCGTASTFLFVSTPMPARPATSIAIFDNVLPFIVFAALSVQLNTGT
jgi:hypothetical protein